MFDEPYSTAPAAAPSTSTETLGKDAPALFRFRAPKNPQPSPGVLSTPGYLGSMDVDALALEAKSDPAAMADLLRHHRGLVLAVVNRFPSSPDEDDAIQLGLVGMARAVHTYDPARGAFAPHATAYIRQEIWTKVARPEKRQRERGVRFVPLTAAPEAPDDEAESLDFELDPWARVRTGSMLKAPRSDQARELVQASPRLTPRQRLVLLERLDGKLQRELGPQQTIQDVEARALRNLHSCK